MSLYFLAFLILSCVGDDVAKTFSKFVGGECRNEPSQINDFLNHRPYILRPLLKKPVDKRFQPLSTIPQQDSLFYELKKDDIQWFLQTNHLLQSFLHNNLYDRFKCPGWWMADWFNHAPLRNYIICCRLKSRPFSGIIQVEPENRSLISFCKL